MACRGVLSMGRTIALTAQLARTAVPRSRGFSLARYFTASPCHLSPGRSVLSPADVRVSARGKALQELLDERDAEKEQQDEDDGPIATSLSWESPLDVLRYPDPKLRSVNATVACFDESLRKLAEEMFVVMYDDDGVGLAAPQVGVNVRMMVFNETGDKEKKESEVVLVNPRIISSSKDAKVFEEGCLSFPKLYGDVIRPSKVRVRAQDLTGKKFVINIAGFPARIFQHEYDHLQGTLFCDRFAPEVLDELRSELVKMEEAYLRINPGAEKKVIRIGAA